MSGGNAFHRFTMRSVKKIDLELTLQCLLRNLKLCMSIILLICICMLRIYNKTNKIYLLTE